MIPRERLRAIFKSLGAKDVATWTRAHADFPALQRWLFLTGLWRAVLPDDELWEPGDTDSPEDRILACGADPRDVNELVRQAQIDVLYEACQLMDDPSHGIEDLQDKIPENVEWRLCEYDGTTGAVGRPMQDLHASFHRFDPTGREGEPRPRPARKANARKKGTAAPRPKARSR
jgi:hypothetical protein